MYILPQICAHVHTFAYTCFCWCEASAYVYIYVIADKNMAIVVCIICKHTNTHVHPFAYTYTHKLVSTHIPCNDDTCCSTLQIFHIHICIFPWMMTFFLLCYTYFTYTHVCMDVSMSSCVTEHVAMKQPTNSWRQKIRGMHPAQRISALENLHNHSLLSSWILLWRHKSIRPLHVPRCCEMMRALKLVCAISP